MNAKRCIGTIAAIGWFWTAVFIWAVSGCKNEGFGGKGCNDPNALNYNPNASADDGSCAYYIEITQADLDSVVRPIASRLTGDFLGISQSHDGRSNPGNTTIRDIFSNVSRNDVIRPGSVFTKRVYEKDSTGRLLVTFAMIKQEIGYFPAGGDFEYIVMPAADTVDYLAHPNGVLPPKGPTRGTLGTACANCHSNGGSDFLFIR